MTKPRTQSFTVKVTIPERSQSDYDIAPFSEQEILAALANEFHGTMAYGGVTFEVEDNAAARRRRMEANKQANLERLAARRAHALQAQEED